MSASKIFRSVFQLSKLKETYFSSVKYNSAIGIDRINSKVFEKNLGKNITVIRNKALNGTYKFSQYREKLLSRGAQKFPRVISIPTLRDKLTLKALFRILSSVYGEESPFLHKVVTEVNNTISQGRYDGVLRLDVKDFYPSIRHDFLIAQLSKKIRKKEVLHLITDSISQQTVIKSSAGIKNNNTKGIPQGLPISNVMANVYMQPIDQKFKKRTSLRYFRYVDDILIFCSQKRIDKIKNEITTACDNIGLTIHNDDPSKIHSGAISDGFSYLGYKFNGPLVTVREKSLENLRESIIKNLTSYKYSGKTDISLLYWTLNLRITGCKFNGTKYGWMFYFSQINDLQLLSSLDHFVKKQLIVFGLDPKKTNLKKFTRAYYEITRNLKSTKYVPNYDLINQTDKSEILRDVFKVDTTRLNDQQIEYQFRQRIFHNVRDLERDLAKHS
jgi:retron-type reverse transcriptase